MPNQETIRTFWPIFLAIVMGVSSFIVVKSEVMHSKLLIEQKADKEVVEQQFRTINLIAANTAEEVKKRGDDVYSIPVIQNQLETQQRQLDSIEGKQEKQSEKLDKIEGGQEEIKRMLRSLNS